MIGRYMRWLHTGWPAGTVERLPEVGEDGATVVSGVRIVGDLTGIPLLKFSADTGARAVQAMLREEDFVQRKGKDKEVYDIAIIGAGVSGVSAAVEAKKHGLSYVLYEAAQEFNTIQNFPKQKPIYTYPTEMVPAGELRFTTDVKEALLDELEAQRKKAGVEMTKAHVDRVERKGSELLVHLGGKEKKTTRALRVIIAIGRSGNYRALGVPGEKLDKVYHRLYDPKEYKGKNVMVVGGGDSALESAIALCMSGANVTLSYRNKEFARPKPDNIEKIQQLVANPDAKVQVEKPVSERVTAAMSVNMVAKDKPGTLTLMLGSKLKQITDKSVELADAGGADVTVPNDVVFAMIGREAPLDFFRRSGIPIRGEWRASTWAGFLGFFAFCFFLYNWKADTGIQHYFKEHNWFPFNVPSLGSGPLALALTEALRSGGFYYSTAYCVCIGLFGWQRIKRRNTPYVTRQTLSLMAFQFIPLFLLPYIVLPALGHAGVFSSGFGKTIGDNLFPDGSYWRSFGLVLAWPLFVWNFFNDKPLTWWLVIGCVQTFVLIPLLVRRYGKGAYCGWICSCGALAETLGDTHRTKMPHGPRWNRLNMVGQVVLAFAMALFVTRIVHWTWPKSSLAHTLDGFYNAMFYAHQVYDYYHVVDLFLAGIVGVGLYFWFSGRVWCRFACPLAALMHIYARFTRFRIFADKKKCISCNVCTSVCHQGIDIMSFANKGLPMQDPECVRCSACVQSCPTGTLTFGMLGADGAALYDTVAASPVQIREIGGKKHLPVVKTAGG